MALVEKLDLGEFMGNRLVITVVFAKIRPAIVEKLGFKYRFKLKFGIGICPYVGSMLV